MGWLAAASPQSIVARRTEPTKDFSGDRIAFLPRGALGDISMTPDEALRLSAVWACVTVTAKALAPCNWDIFLELDNGDRVARRKVAAYSLLNIRPNPETTAFSFKEAMLIQAQVWGNFYAEIEFDRGNRPVALWPLAPDRCSLERDVATDKLVVVVRNRGGAQTILDYEDVFHIHGPSIDGIGGYETVTLAARSLAHAAAAERFGASFYHNGTQFGGLISFANNLGPDARKAAGDAIQEGHKGSSNAWGLLTLDNGAKYQSFGVEPDKAQFVETRYLLIEEICRWFGVPPHKIAHLLRSTFNNIEQQSIEFVRDALTPWAERMRQEADYKLLRPWPGIRSRIDLEWLQEGDAKSKAETDSILVNSGIENRNEVRKRRGRNTIGPDGEKYTVQLAMTTLDKIGMDQPAPVAPPPDAPKTVAARALFRLAAMKALNRRTRVASDLAASALDGRKLESAVREDDKDQARYLGSRIAECLAALKIEGEPSGIRELLAGFIEQDAALVASATKDQVLGEWCDMEVRAEYLAVSLASALEGA